MTPSAQSLAGAGRARSLRRERRTGVAFLSLVLATNFVPWIQLAERATDATRALSAAESALVTASCLFATGLVISAWLLGRRLPEGRGPRVPRLRDAGLALAVLAVGLNLTLAAVIHWRTAGGTASFHDEMKWFGFIWCALVLPAQAAAGFCKGRASVPIREGALTDLGSDSS